VLAVAGANLDAVDSQGHTALLWASYKGLEIIMKILLEHGADPTIADPTGRLPLHWTGRLDSPICTKLLLQASPKWTVNFQDGNERLAPVHWDGCHGSHGDQLCSALRRNRVYGTYSGHP